MEPNKTPKYKVGDVLWRTAESMKLFPTSVTQAYSVTVVAPFFDEEVSSCVHYIVKVYTHIDNFFETIREDVLFQTKQEAEKDCERRYHKRKRRLAKIDKMMEKMQKTLIVSLNDVDKQ